MAKNWILSTGHYLAYGTEEEDSTDIITEVVSGGQNTEEDVTVNGHYLEPAQVEEVFQDGETGNNKVRHSVVIP